MLARFYTFSAVGIDAHLVEVEVDLRPAYQEAFTTIVGLPDTAVKESRDRLAAALHNAGYRYPRQRVLINLAPADIKKHGPVFDLPMALGILIADGTMPPIADKSIAALGELSLDGSVRPVRGVLAATLAARQNNITRIIVPEENAAEAALVPGIDVFPVRTLTHAVAICTEPAHAEPYTIDTNALFHHAQVDTVDFADIHGQEHAKRAAEVAVAGGHNLLLIGPPGSGKTMLARRIPTIMPPLSLDEAIETTRVHSIRGLLSPDMPLVACRPFRAPHHTISDAGLIGGGATIEPGEVSLSHNGVLFLDEFPEFSRRALEVLRQPLEDGVVTITRVAGTLTFPARIMLVAAMNPCPCGYYGHPTHECSCNTRQISSYRTKLSGPLLDRIDLHVEMPAVPYTELSAKRPGVTTDTLRQSCMAARERQTHRFATTSIRCNAHIPAARVAKMCPMTDDAAHVIKMAVDQLGFSARAYHRVLRVARTIADLDDQDTLLPHHLLEAVQYRNLDRASAHA